VWPYLLALITLVLGAYLGHAFTRRRISDANQKEVAHEVVRLLDLYWHFSINGPLTKNVTEDEVREVGRDRLASAAQFIRDGALRKDVLSMGAEIRKLSRLPSDPAPEWMREHLKVLDDAMERMEVLKHRLGHYGR
jgi:hypothetical protein